MEKRIGPAITLIVIGGLGGLAGVTTSHPSQVGALALAAGVVVYAAIVGIRRMRASGHLDLFHPLIFPAVYVATASLAPAAWLWGAGRDLGYIRVSFMSDRTPLLMALATVGFVLGAAIPYGPAKRPGKPLEPATLGNAGRLLLLLPLVLAARDFLANVVMSRGQGQNAFTIVDVLNAAGFIAAPVAFAMIMSSRLQRKLRLLSVVDAVMGGGLILLLGLNGRRGAALAVIVVVLVFATRRKGANLRALFGLAGAAFFAYVVVTYRTAAAGGRTTLSTSAVLLRDLGSVAYTTGGTDRVIHGDYLGGQTLIAGLVRQLPSPIANQLLGPPVDTGTFIFRQITGLTNASQGYGFSIPAEGVLNFGVAGTLILPFAAGAVLAWLYGRFDVTGSRTIALIYPVAVGSVPFAWRSDLLGAVKGVLYPALVLWAVIVVARTISSTNARLGKGSERQIAPHPTSHPTAAPRRPTCGAEGTRATR